MLQMLTFCYNCTEHETTGFAPFYLMFGRVPRLPVDVVFQHVLSNISVVDHREFVAKLRRDLAEAARIAREHSRSEQARQAENYNRRVKGSPLEVGDQVLLANRGERGKRKVADKWESKVYEVISVKPGINVYSIRDRDTQKVKVVHRNLLLPVSFLPAGEVSMPASDCPSIANSVPEIPVEEQDSETKTIKWLLQANGVSDVNTIVSHTDVESVGNQVDEAEVGSVISGQSGSLPPCVEPQDMPAQSPSSPPGCGDSHELSDVIPPDEAPCEAVIDTQPQPFRTRAGRQVKPPARLICEMNRQAVDDSSSVVSVFSFVRSMFSG